ncbi:hypothetical protein ACTXT7_000386 [Hymenolepis weldensis]
MSKDAVLRHREQQKIILKEQGEPDSGGEGAEEISIAENLRPTTELFELRLLILSNVVALTKKFRWLDHGGRSMNSGGGKITTPLFMFLKARMLLGRPVFLCHPRQKERGDRDVWQSDGQDFKTSCFWVQLALRQVMLERNQI